MKTHLPIAVLLLSSMAASAADLPRKPSPPSPIRAEPAARWEGFYLGGHAGYTQTDASKADLSPVVNADQSPISARLRGSGEIAGLQAGYAFQDAAMVYGVEADIAMASLRGRQGADGVFDAAPASVRLEGKTAGLATLRGRIGYAFDRLLVYGTGGMASAVQRSRLAVTTTEGGVTRTHVGSSSGIHIGWTLGLGAEYALTPHVSGRLEYLYANIGDGLRGRSDATGLHMLRTGVNYRF